VTGIWGSPKFYNTLANGDDYADFVSSAPDCGTNQVVQDAAGCLGEDADLSILNDGRGEINILNAVGFDTVSTPEPGTMALFGIGRAALGIYRRRRA
jgi:PEP-CTERM motif